MIICNLGEKLKEVLSQADELWVSVALLTEDGYSFIQREIAVKAKQHYLVGLDLLPPVSVLKKLQSRHNATSFTAAIAKPETGIFHPKLYIVRKSNQLVAFLGSANLTRAGLGVNTELCWQINEEAGCKSLIHWFDVSFSAAFPFTNENIAVYERQLHAASQKFYEADPVSVNLKKSELKLDRLIDIDFEDRYFSKADHLAFRRELWDDRTIAANNERKQAQSQFLKLHQQIYGFFPKYGLSSLYANQENHIVSMYYHLDGYTEKEINAMWLSYGKSQDEIKRYHAEFGKLDYRDAENERLTFINHARIQIRIELKSIGIWLLFGKNNGSAIDRQYFSDQMRQAEYRLRFFEEFKALPSSYWIWLNDEKEKHASEFLDASDLARFCRRDKPQHYFAIGRDYRIDAPEMSKQLLPQTVLKEFSRLHPLYMLMRHKFYQ